MVASSHKGEGHDLAKPANRKDYTVRMREFFNHHMLVKPAPACLKKGVPYLKLYNHLKEWSK
jgi:hypothetical protein